MDTPLPRAINHPYEDEIVPAPEAFCYSVNEILAEKSRALYERQGRARDVYDVVHLSRAFRESVDTEVARATVKKKFTFKELPEPSVAAIVGRIDNGLVRANWNGQLAHQLPVLPDVDGFLDALDGALVWWMEPETAVPEPPSIPRESGETTAPRIAFSHGAQARRLGIGDHALGRITYAARNRLCLRVVYKGVTRTVEPYSIRYPRTGNTLLYVYERNRGGVQTQQIKAFNLSRIQDVEVTTQAYTPRYVVEI